MATSVSTAVGLDLLADQAIKVLGDYLSQKDFDPDAMKKARVAASVLSTWSRHKQTEGARDATTFMVARELSNGDSALFRRYIEVSMPGHPVTKALPEVTQTDPDA